MCARIFYARVRHTGPFVCIMFVRLPGMNYVRKVFQTVYLFPVSPKRFTSIRSLYFNEILVLIIQLDTIIFRYCANTANCVILQCLWGNI